MTIVTICSGRSNIISDDTKIRSLITSEADSCLLQEDLNNLSALVQEVVTAGSISCDLQVLHQDTHRILCTELEPTLYQGRKRTRENAEEGNEVREWHER